ncbi:SdrD B-like domain-containing protein [Neolewinella agarilytica]|uniref:Por secretion system C-terminal sorting domain-containing protein n=1 Tax=Neolewinella agarilytica TaxID=478744 RepID=A0A1H9NTH4_9BACT|nr:SdrD B-like domain-containing protein [Neolewinella agarilytica]SER38965.1 Por secretion system C-terminal sorting domain-containing protein [Neolewinella agarilytica]
MRSLLSKISVGILLLFFPLAATAASPFDFTFTVSNCNEVAFTITGGTPVAQNWDFGDGDQDPAASPVHFYGIDGTFNACLTASNGVTTQTICKAVTIDRADCCTGPAAIFTDVDNCCFELSLDNPVNQFFTGVRLRSASGNLNPFASFDATNWGLPAPPTINEIHLNYTGARHLPTGVTPAFRFCLATPPTGPETVEVEWLIGPTVVCTETVDLTCTSCQPEGDTFSTTIKAKEDAANPVDYEERGYDILIDERNPGFIVAGITSFLNELGSNGNIYFSHIDDCGEQTSLPIITGANRTIPYEIEDVRVVSTIGEGLALDDVTNPFEYVAVATVKKGNRYDYVVVTLQADGTLDFAMEEIFESDPDEFVHDIEYDPVTNCLGIVGTRRDGSNLPVTTKSFVQRICFSSTTGVTRNRQEFAINAPGTSRTTGEAITYDDANKSWFITGQTPDKKMYVMQLDNGLNVIHTEVVDVDANGGTEETGKDIVLTPNNQLAVVGDQKTGGFQGSSKVFLTTFRLPLLPQCDNVKLNRVYDLPGDQEEVNSLVARTQVQGGNLLYTFGGDLNAGGVVGIGPERRRPFIMQVDDSGDPRWQHQYNEANHLEKLIAVGEGFAAAGRTSTFRSAVPVGTYTNDIWAVRVDPNGILPSCDCFDPLEASFEEPMPDVNCAPVDALGIVEVVNFQDWGTAILGRHQAECSTGCGSGPPGTPCPSGCCAYVSGVKFEDTNGDGVKDPFDPNLCGWQIELVDRITGIVVQTATTNSAGFYAFSNLCAGDYSVREVNQNCWSQTFPSAAANRRHDFSTNGESYHFNLDFGNTIDIDCAADKASRLTQTATTPNCTHELEIDNNLCLDLQRVHLRTTNGVTFGASSPKAGYQYCALYPPQATEICIEVAGGGPIPRTNAQQLVDFDLTNICSYQQIPQSVIIDYHVDLPCSFDKVVCSDTLVTDCPISCPNLCTGVSAQSAVDTMSGPCCYDILLTNTRPDLFTQVNVKALGGISIVSPVITDPNWFYLSQTTSELQLIQTQGNACPGSGLAFMPTGTYSPVTICLDNYTSSPQQVEVEWLTCDGQACSDTLDFFCPIEEPTGCAKITRDTFYCDQNGQYKYDFDFLSCWDKDIKSLTVNYLDPSGATVSPTSISFSPEVSPNGTGSGTLCFDNIGTANFLEFQLQFFEDSCCFCFSDTLRMEIPECPCDGCEDLEYTTTKIGPDSTCCWALDIENPCLIDMKSIELNLKGGVEFRTLSAGSGWFFQNLNNSVTRFQPLLPPPGTTPIPTGPINNKIEFCLTNYDNPIVLPQLLEINWIDMQDSIVCQDSLTFDCAPLPPDTCLVILNDTIICLPDGTYAYQWDVVNQSNTTATHIYVHTSYTTPAGGVITPGAPYSFAVTIPPNVAPISMPAINVSNVNPGDQFCLRASIYNTINTPPDGNFCCHGDTTCIIIPECPPMEDLGDCCDSLWVYGNELANVPQRIQHFAGHNFVLAKETDAAGQTHSVFAKFDGFGTLIWETKLTAEVEMLDFTPTAAGDFLLVGRTTPLLSNGWQNNRSALAKINANGTLGFIREYDNLGRESFIRIINHPWAADPVNRYYILGLENQDGTNNSANDEAHLYNIDDAGNINWGQEYTYVDPTDNLDSSDDQIVGMTPLRNGNLLLVGDEQDRKGVLHLVFGPTGETINAFYTDQDIRFRDALELPDGRIVVVGGRYQRSGNTTVFDGMIWLFDASLRQELDDLRYVNQSAGLLTDIELGANGELYATATDRNGRPLILNYTYNAATQQILENKTRYLNEPAADYFRARLYTTPADGRLYYTDGRQDHPDGFGDFDVFHGSFSLSLADTCLVDTTLVYVGNMIQMQRTKVPDTLYQLPVPTNGLTAVPPNYQNGNLCSGTDSIDCCDEMRFFDATAAYQVNRIGNTITIDNPLIGACMLVDIDWGDGTTVQVGQGGFPVSHSYTGSIPPSICLLQTELNNNDPNDVCWEWEDCEMVVSNRELRFDKAFRVAPNPTTGFVSLSWSPDFRPDLLTVLDGQGRVLLREKLSGLSATHPLRLDDFPAGMYFLRLEGGQTGLAIKRIIKQ